MTALHKASVKLDHIINEIGVFSRSDMTSLFSAKHYKKMTRKETYNKSDRKKFQEKQKKRTSWKYFSKMTQIVEGISDSVENSGTDPVPIFLL